MMSLRKRRSKSPLSPTFLIQINRNSPKTDQSQRMILTPKIYTPQIFKIFKNFKNLNNSKRKRLYFNDLLISRCLIDIFSNENCIFRPKRFIATMIVNCYYSLMSFLILSRMIVISALRRHLMARKKYFNFLTNFWIRCFFSTLR